ncbi:MAG TPA: hypothetical protein VFQ60_00025 [Patescibacteria group bacterium]|nr:hypothetical protein [Patescibacteria group bacterium]
MHPSHPLGNPFEIPKERDSNHKAFVKGVLGKGAPTLPKPNEDFGTETDLILSAGDQNQIENERIFSEIILRERRALREFFGKEIAVPPLPKEATRKRILEWRRLGFELHYLPKISMAEIKRDPKGKILEVIPIDFPGWKKKPGRPYTPNCLYGMEFFDEVEVGNLDPSVLDLPGSWILIDAHDKPNYDQGDQMYENDPLAPVLEKFRKEGVLTDFRIKGSRFCLSPQELENPRVLEVFVKTLNLDMVSGFAIGIPRMIEFNILGNIYYPQWGKGTTSEWFSDKDRDGFRRLRGGGSDFGGLSLVVWSDQNVLSVSYGFRLIVRFPSNQEEDKK